MPPKRYVLGRWYESQADIREAYREFWKGILIRGKIPAIIFNYVGARRKHYGDKLDLIKNELWYIGEGKKGDQKLNSRNLLLQEGCKTKRRVNVFFDCGDVFKPKHLLFGGIWRLHDWEYVRRGGRKVFRFLLKPSTKKIVNLLDLSFSEHQQNLRFERDLKKFARLRSRLYAKYPTILRARDSIAGEIGEYFAVKSINQANPNEPLIRLMSAYKDIDAVQLGTGIRFAIKTMTSAWGSTSNIWAERPQDSVDWFVITHLDKEYLTPRYVCGLKSSKIAPFLVKDNYQGSRKIRVNEPFLRKAEFFKGSLREALA